MDLDIEDEKIESYDIESFSEAYEMEPSSGTIRPDGGDYFKKSH